MNAVKIFGTEILAHCNVLGFDLFNLGLYFVKLFVIDLGHIGVQVGNNAFEDLITAEKLQLLAGL